jgi:hypothetical protein
MSKTIKYAGALYRMCTASKDKRDVQVNGTRELLRFWHAYLEEIPEPWLENVEHLLEVAKMECGVINDLIAIEGLPYVVSMAKISLFLHVPQRPTD